jgi:hypothetical protein
MIDWMECEERDRRVQRDDLPLRDLAALEKPFKHFNVYMARDSTLYLDELSALLAGEPEKTTLLLIIPLRLGLDALNTMYIPALQRVLELKQSLGIMGGKPNSAHYFVGYQGENGVCLQYRVKACGGVMVLLLSCRPQLALLANVFNTQCAADPSQETT